MLSMRTKGVVPMLRKKGKVFYNQER